MKHAFFLAAAGTSVGLTTVSLGLFNAHDRRGVRVAFFKPISQLTDAVPGVERSTHFIRATTTLQPADPIPVFTATKMISEGPLPDNLEILERAYLDRDVTDEQRSSRPIFNATLRAAASWLLFRVARSARMTQIWALRSGLEVCAATKLAQAKRPDLLIDGPLPYDAAFMPDAAKTKAPNSPVAGRATVFVFPDFNTGNTTCKAVQGSANVISVGSMLQEHH
jgi:hypothetical protein